MSEEKIIEKIRDIAHNAAFNSDIDKIMWGETIQIDDKCLVDIEFSFIKQKIKL